MVYNIIIAIDNKNGIGNYDKTFDIPWCIKPDMSNFINQTLLSQSNKPNIVIMGRNTWVSIGSKPLKNRINIIISSNLNVENCVKSFSEALQLCKSFDYNEIYIIGGGQLYDEALQSNNIKNIYITLLDHDYKCNIKLKYPIQNLINYKNYKKFPVYDSKNKITVDMHYQSTQIIETNKEENKYLDILKELVLKGEKRETRNSITTSLFSKTLEFDMNNGFPLITTKKVNIKNIFYELLWFLNGDTNTNKLKELGVTIWNGNSSKEFLEKLRLNYNEGDIGPMYGFQLRNYGTLYKGCNEKYNSGIDQLQECINLIKNDPTSRRIIMTTYNPLQAKEGVLYPCHGLITQFYVQNNELHLCTYQRSADWFLGVVWNIASYSLLLHLICSLDEINLKPGRVIIHFGDVHLYNCHYNQAVTQLLRNSFSFPILKIKEKKKNIIDFKLEDLEINNYISHNFIKAEIVV
jgi:dihydrofolate reductase/thymidylate synthase